MTSKPVRLEEETYERLKNFCGEERRMSVVATKAISKYLDDRENERENVSEKDGGRKRCSKGIG